MNIKSYRFKKTKGSSLIIRYKYGEFLYYELNAYYSNFTYTFI